MKTSFVEWSSRRAWCSSTLRVTGSARSRSDRFGSSDTKYRTEPKPSPSAMRPHSGLAEDNAVFDAVLVRASDSGLKISRVDASASEVCHQVVKE